MDASLNQAMLEISYGRMALKVHSIERALVLISAARLSDSPKECDSLIEKYKKLPLGKLVGLVRDKAFFDSEINDHLQNLVKVRNELVHEVGDLVSDSIFSGGKAGDIIEYIASFTGFLNNTLDFLRNELINAVELKGIDFSKLQDISYKAVAKWHS
ncbi:hypothetical protein [Amphritea sp.]|uniref:hypothetical protein n=1 Tax=Amphritea sp. TaxID=1872502 RepID=UPI003D0E4E0E